MKKADFKKFVMLAVALVVLYGGYTLLKDKDICFGFDGKPCDFKNGKDMNKDKNNNNNMY